jgi:tRNA(Arg) A34 adenosine deaminase TadA
MYDETFMQRAIALSAQALDAPGAKPYGAVVVRDGKVVGEGLNQAIAHFDPTSHGEVEAIRDACRKLGTVDLRGCDLYTTCEPCPLCVAAMRIAGIRKLYYAASVGEARKTLEGVPVDGPPLISVDELRAEAGAPPGSRAMPAEQKMGPEAVAVLAAWAASRRRACRSAPEEAVDA